MAEKKNGGLGLPQTKGTFKVRGIVSGVDKDNFYSEGQTKTGNPYRTVSFAVEYEKDKKIYISLMGCVKDSVYFSQKKDENSKEKKETIKRPWSERLTFKKEGCRLIGINVGITKKINAKGKEENENKTYTEYDACEAIGENLKDGMSVFIRGNIEYSTYKEKSQVNFVPNQISLCQKEIDFEEPGYTPVNNFEQQIVFMGIEPNNKTREFEIEAKIIKYNAVEDAEVIIKEDKAKLAATLRNNLSSYNMIKVFGDIRAEIQTEEVEEETSSSNEDWGDENPMTVVSSGYKVKLVVLGADRDSIDKDVYSEEKIVEALAKVNSSKTASKEYGAETEAEDWGKLSESSKEEDSDDSEDLPW